jgi:hypothetical protein
MVGMPVTVASRQCRREEEIKGCNNLLFQELIHSHKT